MQPGRYIQWAHSAHIYREHIGRAQRVASRADDWLEISGSVAPLSYDATWTQMDIFFELEREVRTGTLWPQQLSDDVRFARLAADLQGDLTEVAGYLWSKLTRQKPGGPQVTPAQI